jgi:hypothetical protein
MPPDWVGRMLGVGQTDWPGSSEDRDRAHRAERSPPMQLPHDYVRLRLVELHCQELQAEADRARRSRHLPDSGFLAQCGAALIAGVRTVVQGGQSGNHTRRIRRMNRLTAN